MPLQWLPLQQRQQLQQRSPVSEAMTPRRTAAMGAGAPAGEGFIERERRLMEEEDKRKHELKLMDKQTEMIKLQAGLKEDTQRQQTTMGNVIAQAQQQGAARQQIESNPEPAAKEMYELLKTMPDETQAHLLQQIFTPTTPKGTITALGKQVTMPEKYNPIADVFMSKGWATIDEGGKPVLSEPEREFEKGTFEITTEGGKVYQLNTATGDRKEIGAVDEPESVIAEINKDANEQALAISKASAGTKDVITFEEAKYDVLKDSYNMGDEEAADLSKIKEMPEGAKKKSLIKTFTDWIAGKKETSPEALGAPMKTLGKPTFNEANASALINVISDDVTPAERAHLKTQGATDADIDEAIKRKRK